MKLTRATAVLATALALGLSACVVEDTSTTSRPNRTPSPAPAPAPAPSGDELDEEIYVMTIEDEYGTAHGMSDRELVAVGRGLCEEIDGGMTLAELAEWSMDSGLDAVVVGYVTGAAIAAFCPWNDGFFG